MCSRHNHIMVGKQKHSVGDPARYPLLVLRDLFLL